MKNLVVFGRLDNGNYKLFQHATSHVEFVVVNSFSSIVCLVLVVFNNVVVENSFVKNNV